MDGTNIEEIKVIPFALKNTSFISIREILRRATKSKEARDFFDPANRQDSNVMVSTIINQSADF